MYSASVLQLFINSLERYPRKEALRIGSKSWSYQKLYEEAAILASALVSKQYPPRPARVGLLANKSSTAYLGILGSLMIGAAYIPLNPNFPLERLLSIIEQSQMDALIFDRASLPLLQKLLPFLPKNMRIIATENTREEINSEVANLLLIDRRDLNRLSPFKEVLTTSEEDLVYILFTSGSTGVPKGVPIKHKHLRYFLQHSQERLQLRSEDKLTQNFDLSFDLSMFDIFMCFQAGASLYPLSSLQMMSPYSFLKENKISVWFSVPSAIDLLIKQNSLRENSLPSLRISLFCGEALSLESIQSWQKAAPQSVIENLYGPTELTVACSYYRWNAAYSPQECHLGIVPLGKINEGLGYVLLNENGMEVLPGEPGELCVCGPQRFEAYLNNPERNHSAFVDINHTKYYRSGDLVKQSPGGCLLYLGRIDQQIKISGYRVELGEIESLARKVPEVVGAYVVLDSQAQIGAPRLRLFFSSQNRRSQRTRENLETLLKEYLPHYMVPHDFIELETFPLNSNGKVDRKLLSLHRKLQDTNQYERIRS